VDIELYRQDEEPFRVVSQRAVYDQVSSAAELEGEVHLTGSEGLELWTDRLVVGKEGKRVVSPSPVRFLYGEAIEGSSNRLRVEVPARLFLLQGDVRLRGAAESGTEVSLTSQRGFFEEDRRLLRAEGDVRLTYGRDFIEAQRLSAYLVESQDAVRYVRAQWKVRGRLTVPGGGLGATNEDALPMDVAGEAISLLLDEKGDRPTKIEIEGSDRHSADLAMVDSATGHRRVITSNYMVGDFGTQSLSTVHAFGQVRLAELPRGSQPGGKPLKEARSERAEGSFTEDGSLEILTLLGAVDYREGSLQVVSDRARLGLVEEKVNFHGSPARMISPEGEVTAESFAYNQQRDLMQAAGAVRTALEAVGEIAVPGPLLASGSGPVWVVSEKARWQRTNEIVTFLEGVRAWRGKDLLLADELRIFRSKDVLEAKGDVKTVWHPEPSASGKPSAFEGSALEVSANSFSYDGAEAQLRYRGKVRVVAGPRTMDCGEAQIFLNEENSIQRMNCISGATLREKTEGRVAVGERAVYDPREERILIWGDPVVLKDKRGTELKGMHLVYSLSDGSVEFKRAEEPKPNDDAEQNPTSSVKPQENGGDPSGASR